MSIVTKTGDKGTTGLFGGQRLSKSSPRLHAYGTVDELNAVLGMVLAEEGLPLMLREHLLRTQHGLFRVGADLSSPDLEKGKTLRITQDHVSEVETWIQTLEQALPVLKKFILPSGSKLGSLLHFARTVCRRAERYVVELSGKESVNAAVQVYLNRLGDYLFLAAREANRSVGASESKVEY